MKKSHGIGFFFRRIGNLTKKPPLPCIETALIGFHRSQMLHFKLILSDKVFVYTGSICFVWFYGLIL